MKFLGWRIERDDPRVVIDRISVKVNGLYVLDVSPDSLGWSSIASN